MTEVTTAMADGLGAFEAGSRGPPGTYLDYNAACPLDTRVLSLVTTALTHLYGNPSSRAHAFGWDAAESVEAARFEVRDLIGASPGEVIYTSGATESLNLALKGLSLRAERVRIVTAVTEHEAVLSTCRQLERLEAAEVTYLGVDRHGQIELGRLREEVSRDEPAVVALMGANNETGTIHPLREIAAVVHAGGGLLLSDVTQVAGKLSLDVHREGIDLAAFTAHKMYGPKGVGALFVRCGDPKITLEPLIVGGGQERGLRAGTLNVPGIVGFGEACRIAAEEMPEEGRRIACLRDRLEAGILAELPDVWVNGDTANRLPNTTNLGFPGLDARALIHDMYDVAVSTRSACSSGASGPSHVLKAMGLTNEEAYASIRFSLGRFTTEAEIDHAISRVLASVRKLRRRGERLRTDSRV